MGRDGDRHEITLEDGLVGGLAEKTACSASVSFYLNDTNAGRGSDVVISPLLDLWFAQSFTCAGPAL